PHIHHVPLPSSPTCGRPPDLHSFPTRRSSDLAPGPRQLVVVQERGRTAPATLTIPDHLPALSNLRVAAAQVNRPTVDVQVNASKDRKSTRLNSSHQIISYAVFCLKKKKSNTNV